MTETNHIECECEQSNCHGSGMCNRDAAYFLQTIHGKYRMCLFCAVNLPEKYYTASRDLEQI